MASDFRTRDQAAFDLGVAMSHAMIACETLERHRAILATAGPDLWAPLLDAAAALRRECIAVVNTHDRFPHWAKGSDGG